MISQGVEESMPDGIMRISPISFELIPASGVMTTLRADHSGKLVKSWSVGLAGETATFSGWIMSITPNVANGQSPEVSKYTVVIKPTGGNTWS